MWVLISSQKHAADFSALSSDLPEVQKEVVDKHNTLRRQVEPSASNMLRMLVWYKSYLIGCAVSHCDHKIYKYFYVCQYCPAGNVLGINYYSPYKKGERCGDCPSKCDDGLCTNPCTYEDEFSNCAQLKKAHSCNPPLMKASCRGSCLCESEIQ
ncbi:hypothetical protein JD844_023469 [Phrynosoma platyrhinos]|uniref:ShKT domain-containing protein n=1 Tax=Phrynosoma platyrhinos TaxID=52577 RepID=A0ABQ7SX29_PHRPL|nr:hypothetical protein JD844_023469 [Phrynosoma platyrhinos]